jgi:MFS family permease
MPVTTPELPVAARPIVVTLLPMVTAVFTAYLVIGIAMPVLPLHVHQGLGFGTFVVGLVAGSQFTASLVSRFWAGHHADTRGAKRAVIIGLLAAAVSGLLYLLSLRLVAMPVMPLTKRTCAPSGT